MDKNFTLEYDAFGNRQVPEALLGNYKAPVGLVPNNAQDAQSGTILKQDTSIQANLRVDNGALWAGKMDFNPDDTTVGYRLGIERQTQIPKFLIGGNGKYLIWDGSNLVVQGKNVSFDADGTITAGQKNGQRVVMNALNNSLEFYDQNNSLKGKMLGSVGNGLTISANQLFIDVTGSELHTSTGNMTFSSKDALFLKSKNGTLLESDDIVSINTNGPSIDFYFDATDLAISLQKALDLIIFQKPLLLARIANDPAGVPGMMYYNTTTNKFRIFEGSAWRNM